MAGAISIRLLLHPRRHHHVEALFHLARDHGAHAAGVIGGVAVDQNVDVRLDIGEHPPHHEALALMRLAPDHRAGGAGDLLGIVGRIVVVDIDRGLGELGPETGDHPGDGRLFVEARDQHGQTLVDAGPPFLRPARDRLGLRHQFASFETRRSRICVFSRTCRGTLAFLCLRVLLLGALLLAVIVPFEGHSPTTIDRLIDLVTADMGRVNTTILLRTGSQVTMIPEVANHLISSGGKRLRPILTLAMARLAGYDGAGHVKLAAAVEFMHTATLLHDDVVDESEMRRGKLAARMLWGNEASVLVGDFLLGQAFKMMVEVGSLHALDVLSTAAAVIAEGEVMQLSAAKNTATTEDEYLAVVRGKTAALFAAACEVGPVLTQRPKAEAAACRSFGMNLGIAFQLVDDALDYGGTSAKLGKNVGDDFREGKITLPVVLSYRRGSDQERTFWKRAMEQGEVEDRDLDEAVSIMRRHRALDDTIERARHYGAMARDALALFPKNPMKQSLLDTVDFCIARAH